MNRDRVIEVAFARAHRHGHGEALNHLVGAELGITSDGFFDLARLPRRVGVVGSGYIAVELAGVLRALGSEVSLFARHDTVLRHFDAMLGDKLMAAMRGSGIEVVTSMTTRALVREQGGGLALQAGDDRSFAG